MAEYKQVKIGKLKLKGSSSGKKSKLKKRKRDRTDEGVEEEDEDAINHGGWWAIKEYAHLRSCNVALQTHKGNFIKARDNGTLIAGEFHEDQSPEVEEIFTLIKLSETKVAFKSGYGKKHILKYTNQPSPARLESLQNARGSLYVQIACAAVFVSLNNSSIVSFCCFTKISPLEPRLKFKVRGREIGRARQTFQSGTSHFA